MPTTAPLAAKPSKQIFDPFNSSATGHQRAENRLSGSTSWRDSRSRKLREQFSSGAGGGKRVSDSVGAGSLDFGEDGRTENGGWEKGAKGLRTGGQRSIWESWGVEKKSTDGDVDDGRPKKKLKVQEEAPKATSVVNPWTPYRKQDGTIRESSWTSHECSPSDLLEPISPQDATPTTAADTTAEPEPEATPEKPQIFTSLTIYINGSTAPHSDHKIKHLISTHGGNLSISLGRRTVTHVIISKPNGSSGGYGVGGGLAGSKIQKEIAALKGSVKFVTADWVVESVREGKRLPESRFEGMGMRSKGTGRIDGIFKRKGEGK